MPCAKQLRSPERPCDPTNQVPESHDLGRPENTSGSPRAPNNALRELGGVFGVAALATVVNRPGVHSSPDTFVSGFHAALWVAVAGAFAGVRLVPAGNEIDERIAAPSRTQGQLCAL